MILNGRRKFLGHCYIGFENLEAVQKALLLSGHPMTGRFLKIENVSKEKFHQIKSNLLQRRLSNTRISKSPSYDAPSTPKKVSVAKKTANQRTKPVNDVLFSEYSNSTDYGHTGPHNSHTKEKPDRISPDSIEFENGFSMFSAEKNENLARSQPDLSEIVGKSKHSTDYANFYPHPIKDHPKVGMNLLGLSSHVQSGQATMQQTITPPPGLPNLPSTDSRKSAQIYTESPSLAQFKYQQHFQQKYQSNQALLRVSHGTFSPFVESPRGTLSKKDFLRQNEAKSKSNTTNQFYSNGQPTPAMYQQQNFQPGFQEYQNLYPRQNWNYPNAQQMQANPNFDAPKQNYQNSYFENPVCGEQAFIRPDGFVTHQHQQIPQQHCFSDSLFDGSHQS